MISHRDRIIALLRTSDLTQDERHEFAAALYFVGDDRLASLLELFEQDPSAVRTLYQNFQTKMLALKKGGTSSLQKIRDEERAFFESL